MDNYTTLSLTRLFFKICDVIDVITYRHTDLKVWWIIFVLCATGKPFVLSCQNEMLQM
jgi:hypothetical protein